MRSRVESQALVEAAKLNTTLGCVNCRSLKPPRARFLDSPAQHDGLDLRVEQRSDKVPAPPSMSDV